MAWHFDHADWQVWRGAIPAGGMPVPTLADHDAPIGPVLRMGREVVLLSDGSIVGIGAKAGYSVAAADNDGILVASSYGFGYLGKDGNFKILPAPGGVPVPLTGAPTDGKSVGGGSKASKGNVIKADGSNGVATIIGGAKNYIWEGLNPDGSTVNTNHPGPYVRLFSAFETCIGQKADGSIEVLSNGGYTSHVGLGPLLTGVDASGWKSAASASTQYSSPDAALWAVHADGTVHVYGMRAAALTGTIPSGSDWVAVGTELFGYPQYLRSDGHIIRSTSAAGGLTAEPVQAATFHAHPLIRDAGNVADAVLDFASLMGSTDSQLPWEIEWGDGTSNTAVPLGTPTGTTFQHTYADNVDHTVRIVVPRLAAAADTAIAHRDAANTRNQYLFTFDTGTGRFEIAEAEVYETADSAFHPALVQVYDTGKAAWVK